MRRNTCLALCGAITFLAGAVPVHATPLDFSGFSVWESVVGSVQESGGVVSFTENAADGALYFCNDLYDVAADAGVLSFDFEFPADGADPADYGVLDINYSEVWSANQTKLLSPPFSSGSVAWNFSVQLRKEMFCVCKPI